LQRQILAARTFLSGHSLIRLNDDTTPHKKRLFPISAHQFRRISAQRGFNTFVAEVKRFRGKKNPLSVAALKSLRNEHARTQATEALQLERQLSDVVNEAYGLTPDEVALLWQTAPPRMPLAAQLP
jgi:flagellar biosynthesis regulator FlbT